MLFHLKKHALGLAGIGARHVQVNGTFAVLLEFVYPKAVFYNKQGTISSKSHDLSNVEKGLIDLIFGATMGVNDKYITKLVSTKRSGAEYSINVQIELY